MGAQAGSLTGTTLGRFRIGTLIRRGGMGEVYHADDAELGRSVALQVLPESLLGDLPLGDRVRRAARDGAPHADAQRRPHQQFPVKAHVI